MKNFSPFQMNYATILKQSFMLFLAFPFFSNAQTCSSPIPLTPSTGCSTVQGDLQGVGHSDPIGVCGGATATTTKGVWFTFTATASNPTITVGGLGSNLSATTTYVEVLSGTCAPGIMTSIACQDVSAPLSLAGLTPGLYYIRVYVTGSTTSGAQTNRRRFTICITNPLAAPSNDLCTDAIPLSSSTTCSTISGTLNSGTTYTPTANACSSNNDIWYSFVAKSANPTITLSSGPSNIRAQIMEGDCISGFTAVGACPASGTTTASNLTVGNTYYVRIYSTTDATGTFNICVTDPAPSNDACGTPATLTSNSSCSYTLGNLYGATVAANPPIAPCTGPATYDVWYQFVAQDFNSTINLDSIGSDIVSPGIQLVTNNCTNSAVVYGCGTTSLTASNLTIGNTYYIRVYGTGIAPASAANAGFKICVTHPTPPPPPNDECTNAITLLNNSACNSIYGNVENATASAVAVAPCTGPVAYDVWYKFTAVTTTSTITLSGTANNFTNRALQLFSGNCGALSSIGCGTTSIAATGLIIGNTYYIRVYSTSGTAPTGNGFFQICVNSTGAPLRFGNSYVNITKKTTGGVVEPGDILEIRMTINHTAGTAYALRYVDNLPTNTTIVPGSSISVITNEGIVVPGKSYTLASTDDAATYNASPGAGEYNIRMNLGFGSSTPGKPVNTTATESASATGTMVAATDIPKGTSNTMLFATSFRVQVTGSIGDVITLGTGQFIYKASAGGADITLTATPYQILISTPMSLCANATGINMSQESGGTFGNGATLNRAYDLASPMPGYTFVNISALQNLGDGQYSIVKNMSPRSGINRNADRVGNCVAVLPSQDACAQRMHTGHWEVDGDHTGSGNAIGNIPTAEGTNAGYMLMVNADYVASEVYRQMITGLCPNTYYEFSAWVRNICATCGNDYTTGNNYTPSRQPGVLPNLTFALDGYDRYNTGEIPYDIGGGSNGWTKKGFVFITGPTQTSAVFSIRNNSQGGGGNDWVMDDISIATCLPSMTYTPTLNPAICENNPITINNTIRSYFSNYNYYKWQKSTDNGTTWADIPGETGSATPTPVGGQWEYLTSYTIPPGNTQPSNNGDRYRQIVATTAANLNVSSCQVTDGISIITLNVLVCGTPLSTNLLSFTGKQENARTYLSWITSRESEPVTFILEKSFDRINFSYIGSSKSYKNYSSETNSYSFIDSAMYSGKAYYRLAMRNEKNNTQYSRILQIGTQADDFDMSIIKNPFSKELLFTISSGKEGKVEVTLLAMSGAGICQKEYTMHTGINQYSLPNTNHLPSGVYILQAQCQGKIISKKLIKN